MSRRRLKGFLVAALLAMSGVGAAGQDTPLIAGRQGRRRSGRARAAR